MKNYDEKRKEKLLSVFKGFSSTRYSARHIAIASLVFLDSQGMLPMPEQKWKQILHDVARFDDPHGRMIAFTNENREHHHKITQRKNGHINIREDIKHFLQDLSWKLDEAHIENVRNVVDDNAAAMDSDALAFAQGDSRAGSRLFTSNRSMTKEELREAIQKAEDIGNRGERLVADYFESCLAQKSIRSYEWSSHNNAISPYDFRLISNSGINSLLDVKSTSGEFNSRMYISMGEIREMAKSPSRYDIYRIYNLTERGGSLRIAEGMRDIAQSIIDGLHNLPEYINVDSLSVDTKKLEMHFGEKIELFFNANDEE